MDSAAFLKAGGRGLERINTPPIAMPQCPGEQRYCLGSVMLEGTIDRNGAVINIRVLQVETDQPRNNFAAVAKAYFSQSRYRPPRIGSSRVCVRMKFKMVLENK
jgi:hypothetical protein